MRKIYIPRSYRMMYRIPRQFSDAEFGKKVTAVMKGAKENVEKSMIMTIFTNLLLAGSVNLIWTFINALQMSMV